MPGGRSRSTRSSSPEEDDEQRPERITQRADDGVLERVTDDGMGGAAVSRGHGLSGLEDRLVGVDGRLIIASPVGGPTQITATIPLAL